jgi:hypothetical protein
MKGDHDQRFPGNFQRHLLSAVRLALDVRDIAPFGPEPLVVLNIRITVPRGQLPVGNLSHNDQPEDLLYTESSFQGQLKSVGAGFSQKYCHVLCFAVKKQLIYNEALNAGRSRFEF